MDDPQLEDLARELEQLKTALQRLVFLLEDRRLLATVELDAVRELWGEVSDQRPAVTLGGAGGVVNPATQPEAARKKPSRVAPREAASPRKSERESSDRSTVARIAANERWAKTEDRSAATQPARDAMTRKFEDQVDPDRKLPADERARRAENARRAHYQRLALKSAQARRAKRRGGGADEDRRSDGT